MKTSLASSLLLIVLCSGLLSMQSHDANAVPFSYNQAAPTFPSFNTQHRHALDILMSSGNDGIINNWFYLNNTQENWIYQFAGSSVATTNNHSRIGPLTLITQSTALSALNVVNANVTVTIPSGLNNVTIVFPITVANRDNANAYSARILSISIAGSPFTFYGNKTQGNCNANVHTCDAEFWYITNPPSGTSTITVRTIASSYGAFSMGGKASVFSNSEISSPIGASAKKSGNPSANPNNQITPLFSNSWLMDNNLSYQLAGISLNSGNYWVNDASANNGYAWGATYHTEVPISGLNKINYTLASIGWVDMMVEVKPAKTNLKALYLGGVASTTGSDVLEGLVSNGTKIYYVENYTNVNSVDVNTGIITHLFSSPCNGYTTTAHHYLFLARPALIDWCYTAGGSYISSPSANQSLGVVVEPTTYSNQKIGYATHYIRENFNGTSPVTQNISGSACELLSLVANATTQLTDATCDKIISSTGYRYQQGLSIFRSATASTNSMLGYYTSTVNSPYKVLLTLIGDSRPFPFTDTYPRFIFHNVTQDLLFVDSGSGNLSYLPTSALLPVFTGLNYAVQTYMTTYTVGSPFSIPNSMSHANDAFYYYGPSINVTYSRVGLMTLLSGYSFKSTTVNTPTSIRLIDPQWTNDVNVYPTLFSTTPLFPIVLTVTNAPTDASIIASYSVVSYGGTSSIWSVNRLDATHSAEIDVPSSTCFDIFIADDSINPAIYIYQGTICATGTNTKTIQYTQTLPLSFYSSIYGATSNYSPTTNGLQTIVRATNSTSYIPFTYNVLVKNSTGIVALNQTFTSNTPLNTQNFNVSGVSKTASLYISVNGKQLYSSYLGSSISFASVVSFFHQYLSYQGFDMLAFIPIVFASMFTRNTVGVGMAMTVVLIASMSWLSIEVVSDTTVYISILVAIIGMIGYRAYGY